jgi:hypothetical protein
MIGGKPVEMACTDTKARTFQRSGLCRFGASSGEARKVR